MSAGLLAAEARVVKQLGRSNSISVNVESESPREKKREGGNGPRNSPLSVNARFLGIRLNFKLSVRERSAPLY